MLRRNEIESLKNGVLLGEFDGLRVLRKAVCVVQTETNSGCVQTKWDVKRQRFVVFTAMDQSLDKS